MPELSVVIITLNAKRTLEALLRQFDWVEDIIILDSGSTDDTELLAQKYRTRFLYQNFLGFGKQKQMATSLARNEWVLNLDADETISDELMVFLKQKKYLTDPEFQAYSFPTLNVFLGTEMKFWNWKKDRKVRLFAKSHGAFSDANVHEQVFTTGRIKKTSMVICHHSYRDIHHYFNKFNVYTSAAAADLKKRNKKANSFIALVKMYYRFTALFFFRGGFTLGWQGLIWSVFSSFYVFVKYTKLEEENLRT